MNPVRNKKSEIFAGAPKASRISNGMKGTALIYVILTVGVILGIVFFTTAIFASKLRLAFDFPSSVTALYSAESGLEWQLYNTFKDPDANQPVLTNGSTFTTSVSPLKSIGKFRGVSRSFEISSGIVPSPTPTPIPTPTPPPGPPWNCSICGGIQEGTPSDPFCYARNVCETEFSISNFHSCLGAQGGFDCSSNKTCANCCGDGVRFDRFDVWCRMPAY
ncbi:MAG: hypothetical protein AAB584_02255 [Patescibacteria group bacterium]